MNNDTYTSVLSRATTLFKRSRLLKSEKLEILQLSNQLLSICTEIALITPTLLSHYDRFSTNGFDYTHPIMRGCKDSIMANHTVTTESTVLSACLVSWANTSTRERVMASRKLESREHTIAELLSNRDDYVVVTAYDCEESAKIVAGHVEEDAATKAYYDAGVTNVNNTVKPVRHRRKVKTKLQL